MNMNIVLLNGRLTNKPELYTTENGKKLCKFTIAVNCTDRTDFINCRVWEQQAENLVKYQNKGNLISVSGTLRVDSYEKQDGTKATFTYVLAHRIEYLSNASSTQTESHQEEVEENDDFAQYGSNLKSDEIVLGPDDLPF